MSIVYCPYCIAWKTIFKYTFDYTSHDWKQVSILRYGILQKQFCTPTSVHLLVVLAAITQFTMFHLLHNELCLFWKKITTSLSMHFVLYYHQHLYKWKRCSKKKCCKQCGQVKFMGTMTKWPVQKHAEHHKTWSKQRRNRHKEITIFCVFRFF